ncbi:MAG: hypothetical protein AB7N80_12815 [Bdellovibrionales bacterium]
MKQFRVENKGNECVIHISGTINENSDFSQLRLEGSKLIYLDLSEVKNLNSMGLRNWVMWIKQLKVKSQMVFRNCPRTVVDQMNILQGFLPMGAIVESFFVPYACPACGKEESYLAVRGKDYMEGSVDTKEGSSLPENGVCKSCGAKTEIDIIPSKYFNFLKYRRI